MNVSLRETVTHCYALYLVIGILGSVALLTIASVIVCYRYRWKIRPCFLKISSYRNVSDDRPYKFDGFVVYSDEDRQWVHHTMLDEMENVRKFMLCAHHRNFIPGHDIDVQIVHSVDTSRKTVLILSKHFLESSWCQYEMSVARNKLQAQGKDVVVPILLTQLPSASASMTESVKNLLREKTYLKWETSIAGQQYFWKKLELALRSKSRIIVKKETQGEYQPLLPRGVIEFVIEFESNR